MNQVAVIGSINMDLVLDCTRLPLPGETVLARGAREVPGGKGANQAVAAARAGASTIMLGRVGEDAFATKLRDGLAASQVDTSFIAQAPGQLSGLAVIGVEDSGENSIMVAPGANNCLAPEDVIAFSKHIAASDILVLQLEIPLATVEAAIRIARENKTLILLDPAPAPTGHFDFVWEVDILCPNQAEAATLLARPIENAQQARDAAVEICRRGVQHAIITLGAQGVVYCSAAQAENGPQQVDAFPVKAIDSTAAGDAFAGALASRWGRLTPPAAIRFACAAGALAASRAGAQPSLPTAADIQALLDR